MTGELFGKKEQNLKKYRYLACILVVTCQNIAVAAPNTREN
jgi:hypothetical protein